MIKFIFMPSYKGWFKGLGLHHALIVAGFIAPFHFFGIGYVAALLGTGHFLGREHKESQIRRDGGFEIMDFASPAIVSILYLMFWG